MPLDLNGKVICDFNNQVEINDLITAINKNTQQLIDIKIIIEGNLPWVTAQELISGINTLYIRDDGNPIAGTNIKP